MDWNVAKIKEMNKVKLVITAYNVIKWMPCEKNNIFLGVAFTKVSKTTIYVLVDCKVMLEIAKLLFSNKERIFKMNSKINTKTNIYSRVCMDPLTLK